MGIPAVLARADHRPWPLPDRRWVMLQTWHDLCFAHWPLAPEAVRPLIPHGLELDLHDGCAWVGVIPFRMTVRLRAMPPLPPVWAFEELNVRTYVRVGERRGIYFFSLDAKSRLAVAAARRWYRLPYFHARMQLAEADGRVRYRSQRTQRGAPPAELRMSYAPSGEPFRAAPDSLAHFLTERYALYTVGHGEVRAAEIHHAPWPLQPAEASIEANTMAAASGITLPQVEPLLHFARRLDVVIWSPRRTA